MTIIEYITNPAGKGSSILANTEIKSSLNAQFDLLKDRIKHKWFIKSNRYAICHILVPSRSAENLYYDVVFEFDLLTISPNDLNINNAVVKMFSNCPSFSYTYAYTFNQQNLLCSWLASKYDRKVLHKEPNVRNQYKIISYERSIYLAAKYILSSERNRLSVIKNSALTIPSYNQIINSVSKQSQIEDQYNAIVEKQKKDKTKEANKSSSSNTPEIHQSSSNKNAVKYTKNTPSVKSSNKTAITKKSKTVKKV